MSSSSTSPTRWQLPPALTWGTEETARGTITQLRRGVGIAGVILMAVTWRLWFAPASFPAVPFVGWLIAWPVWVDQVAAAAMGLALVGLILAPGSGRWASISSVTFAGALVLAVLLNQHRLQPWAWEFLILLLVMQLAPPMRAVAWMRLVVVSIYLHSGLSKCDVTFLTSHGETLLAPLTALVGWDLADAPTLVRRLVVAALPVGEIGVAVGLCFQRTQRPAAWFSFVMHAALLWILGPWGLGHQPGVLIWNGFFIGQNAILFQPLSRSSPASSEKPGYSLQAGPRYSFSWKERIGAAFMAAVVLLPFLEPWGGFDHWPSWAVYASRPERVRVYVAGDRVQDLPTELQSFITQEPADADAVARWLQGEPAWVRVRIDQWSLQTTGAPLYPEARFQLGIALALAKTHQLGDDLRVELDTAADRWTGERITHSWEGVNELQTAADTFWFNAQPRP